MPQTTLLKRVYLAGILLLSAAAVSSNGKTIDDSFRTFLGSLERYEHTPNDIVFLLDQSGYVGKWGFSHMQTLTKRIAQRFPVSAEHSRIAVVTFETEPKTHINYIENPAGNNMCSLLKEIDAIPFNGEYRHMSKGMEMAEQILAHAQPDSEKIIILFMNGKSNAGFDPVPISKRLKSKGVIIFVIGIEDTNMNDITDLATSVDHAYFLPLFDDIPDISDFLLGDLRDDSLDFVKNSTYCGDRCGQDATCFCGIRTGTTKCVCNAGYFGNEGNKGQCLKCPRGTYKSEAKHTSCIACPLHSTTLEEGSTDSSDCLCLQGYERIGPSCVMCREGTYKFKSSNTTCVSCPSHSTTPRKGSTRFSDCLCVAGYVKVGTICSRIPSQQPPKPPVLPPGSPTVELNNSHNSGNETLPEPGRPPHSPAAENPSCNETYLASRNYDIGDDVNSSLPLLAKLIRSLPKDKRLPKIMQLLNELYDYVEKNKEK